MTWWRRDRYKPEDPAETAKWEAAKRGRLSVSGAQMADLIRMPTGPAMSSGCGSLMYEPGVTHEHRCLASSSHPGLDHTCECGARWPDVLRRGEEERRVP